MNKLYSIFNLSLLMLIFLLISACSDSVTSYDIQLMPERSSHVLIEPNRYLMIHVSEQFENPQLIGGDNFSRNINFHGIIPWLRSRIISINLLDCILTKKIKLNIAVKKLYTTVDSEVLIGTLVLNAKITTANGKVFTRNYRGDCKIDFFYLNEKKGIQSCLNSSLNLIIPSIRKDICEINKQM